MNLYFRSQKHTDHEIQMGHKLSFSLATGFGDRYRFMFDDCISATANTNGFSTLNAIARVCKWDKAPLKFYADLVNEHHVIRTLNEFEPPLILVPQTRGSTKYHSAPEYYITEILKSASYHNVRRLQFTHYSFITGRFPEREISAIFKVLLNPLISTTLKTFIFEIDSRYEKHVTELYLLIANNVYRQRVSKPRVERAPEFGWDRTEKLKDGWEVQYFTG
ncbi:hypothetical protein G6720_03820 [Polynucleobacter paneuropaeus]|nr:hypothetical protein G6720_03820 [Polynucleobacter paneuropaeus]